MLRSHRWNNVRRKVSKYNFQIGITPFCKLYYPSCAGIGEGSKYVSRNITLEVKISLPLCWKVFKIINRLRWVLLFEVPKFRYFHLLFQYYETFWQCCEISFFLCMKEYFKNSQLVSKELISNFSFPLRL